MGSKIVFGLIFMCCHDWVSAYHQKNKKITGRKTGKSVKIKFFMDIKKCGFSSIFRILYNFF